MAVQGAGTFVGTAPAEPYGVPQWTIQRVSTLGERGSERAVDAVGSEDADEAGTVLHADHRLVVAEQDRQRMLEGRVEVDGGAEVTGGDSVEGLEMAAVEPGHPEPP